MKAFLLAGLLLPAGAVFAQSGADFLLEATGESVDVAGSASDAAEKTETRYKLTDHFLQALFVEWKSTGPHEFEVNRWVGLVLTQDFKAAAHLWSSIQTSIPEKFESTAAVTWAYLSWRMDLPQTFLGAWAAAREVAGGHRAWLALDQALMKERAQLWLAEKQVTVSDSLVTELMSQDPEGFSLEVAAWALRNNPPHAVKALELLPIGHHLSLTLASAAVLNFARANKLGEAGKLLKRRIEPELAKIGDPKLLAKHYLTLGRLLYQSGALEASEAFYARIPKGVPEFVPARAERSWALLRLGRVGELRGELESLDHAVLKDRFLPEVTLVRAISNLKLCRYGDVAKDFEYFIKSNKGWVEKTRVALSSSDPAIDIADEKITNLLAARRSVEQEQQRLKVLTQESIKAALPAVGEQKHWLDAQTQLARVQTESTKDILAQKRRFWKNRELVLAEAIRKMKFVKIEAMGQLRLARTITGGDVVSTVSSAAKDKQSYPFEDVYWPDELFQLHAAAEARCQGGEK